MFSLRIDEHLTLRPFEARDKEALFELIDANRSHLQRWFPWVDETKSPSDLDVFIARGRKQLADEDGFQAGIWQKGRLIGSVGLHYLDWRVRSTEIGYWLEARSQGQGIMTKVVAVLCEYLFDEYRLRRIEIRCDPANRRSRALPERLGFTEEGVLRQVCWGTHGPYDHVVYGLLAEEWQARRKT
jgi:ribosomal-protein-serine acetyltransferase